MIGRGRWSRDTSLLQGAAATADDDDDATVIETVKKASSSFLGISREGDHSVYMPLLDSEHYMC